MGVEGDRGAAGSDAAVPAFIPSELNPEASMNNSSVAFANGLDRRFASLSDLVPSVRVISR